MQQLEPDTYECTFPDDRVTLYDKNETLQILNSLLDVSLDTLPNRIKLQKLGYLAQQIGSFARFTFSWYTYGPYSSSLADDLYKAEETGFFERKSKLSKSEKHVADTLKKFLGTDFNDPYKLMLHACVWYLLPNKITKDDKIRVADVMLAEMRGYTKSNITKSINKIIKFRKQM